MTSSLAQKHSNKALKPSGSPPRICVGCKGPILDQFILRVAPNQEWHGSCLKCSECKMSLDETCTCFVRDQKIYCKNDYVRLFSARCAKCQDLFSPDDFVMRAKNQIFHLKCFQCLCCGKQLVQGDEFALKNDKIFCKHCADLEAFDERFEEIPERNNNKRDNYRHADHYQHLFAEMASKAHTQECASSTTSEGLKSFKEESGEEKELFDFDDEDEDNSSDMKFNGRDMKRSSVDERIEGTPDSHSSSDGTLKSPALGEDQQHQVRRGRAGRVRTVLTEKQLNMLKSCYQVNKRPDALVKEQLVELTGLSPRVVRVWFQNKRCKDKKKMALLQEKESQKHGYGSMHGIPMVASNPVINDTSLIPAMANQPVDVQHFEAPWKSLYDFASNLDPDKIGRYPPFQPLSQQLRVTITKSNERNFPP